MYRKDIDRHSGGGNSGAPALDDGFWVDLPAAAAVQPEPCPGGVPVRPPEAMPESVPGTLPPDLPALLAKRRGGTRGGWASHPAANTDPLGSWTGVPARPDETPVQDADDL